MVDRCGTSSERKQSAEIGQDCPLRPYLFIAVQTAMLRDTLDTLKLRPEPEQLVTKDICTRTILFYRRNTLDIFNSDRVDCQGGPKL
eukprot:3364647-Pyramimonas_sp.AAC.1